MRKFLVATETRNVINSPQSKMDPFNETLLRSVPKVKRRGKKGIVNKSFDDSTESSLNTPSVGPTRITVQNVEVYRQEENQNVSKPVAMPRSRIPKWVRERETEDPTPNVAPEKPKRTFQKERDVEGKLEKAGSTEMGIPMTTFVIDETDKTKYRKSTATTHKKESSSSTTTTISTLSSTTGDLSTSADSNKKPETGKGARKRKKKTMLERDKSLDSVEESGRHNSSIGIYVHDMDFLKFRSDIESVHIRISCYDESNGQLLGHRGRRNHTEIEPLISKKCRFENVNYLHCIWEELLLIQENMRVLKQDTSIVFFEIIAKVNTSSDFKTLAWAFLKPFARDKFDNLDKRLKLQVYYFHTGMNLFQNWRNTKKHRRYPSILTITLKSITPLLNNNEGHQTNEKKEMDGGEENNPFDVSSLRINKNFKLPNQVFSSLKLPGKGTNLLQINGKGDLVAIANPSSASNQILLSTIPELKVVQRLEGHTDFIYGLDWRPTTDYPLVLISCSADHSLFVWTIEKNYNYSVQVIPHLTFMYCCRFWMHHGKELILVAGKDSIIRAWTATKGSFRNYQEMSKGTGFYTSLVVAKNSNIYSGDSEGRVLEWTWNNNSAFQFTRAILEDKTPIVHLELHPRIDKIYVGNQRGVIQSIDMDTRLVIQRYQIAYLEPEKFFHFRISNCGTYLIAVAASRGISCWNILTNAEINLFDFIPESPGVFSSIDLPKSGSLAILGRYKTNKNAVILLNNSNSVAKVQNPAKDPSPSLATVHLPEDPKRIVFQNQLSEIIRRLDEVFGLPRLCDDEKISLLKEKGRIEEWLDRKASDHIDDAAEEEEDVRSNGTYTVEKEEKAVVVKEQKKTKKIKVQQKEEREKPSNGEAIEDVNGQDKAGSNNSGTYEIKKIRDTDADDTSLSNSDLNLEG